MAGSGLSMIVTLESVVCGLGILAKLPALHDATLGFQN